MIDNSIVGDAFRYIDGGYSDEEDDLLYDGGDDSSDEKYVEFKPGLPMRDLIFDVDNYEGGNFPSLYNEKKSGSIDVISAFLSPISDNLTSTLLSSVLNRSLKSEVVSPPEVFPDMLQFKKELVKYLNTLDKLDIRY